MASPSLHTPLHNGADTPGTPHLGELPIGNFEDFSPSDGCLGITGSVGAAMDLTMQRLLADECEGELAVEVVDVRGEVGGEELRGVEVGGEEEVDCGAAIKVRLPPIDFLPASPPRSNEAQIVVENWTTVKEKKKTDPLRRFFDRAHKRGSVHKR